MVANLGAAIIVHQVIDKVSAIFHMSGIIQLTFMNAIVVRVLNIKTNTGVIHVTKIFTLVQVIDKQAFYRVVHQTLLGKEIIGWEVEFTIAFYKKSYSEMVIIKDCSKL